MQVNYYPWDIQALVAWLETEKSKFNNFETFARTLGISSSVLWEWKGLCKLDISLEQINTIAKYRNWSVSKTAQWLSISKLHLESLEEK